MKEGETKLPMHNVFHINIHPYLFEKRKKYLGQKLARNSHIYAWRLKKAA